MATALTDPTQDPNALTIAKPKPQVPGQAGGTPPLAPGAPPIPTPTVAAPTAPVDRLALAKSNFDTFANQTQAPYEASLRSASSEAAGQGQLGSGQYRTSVGNLVLARQRDLDTQRADLVNKATEGSIADATTAYQQALAASQQGEANKLGEGNLKIAQQSADTAEKGTLGSLDVQKGQLELAKTGQTASIDQNQQQIDLAKKTADINAAYQAGTLTLAQKDQALRELSNTQQNTIATEQLQLAKGAQDVASKVALGQLTIAQATQALNEKVQTGELTIAEKDQALKELSQKQTVDIQNKQLAEQTAARLQQGAQFDASQAQSKDQFAKTLAENSRQFGLSQDQQMALAKLQNDTQNKSIDASTAQGKNQLLVQLASILGGPTGALNPDVLSAIAKSLGVIIPAAKTGAVTVTDPTTITTGKKVGPNGEVVNDSDVTEGG